MSSTELTAAQAASRLGISVSTLYGWLSESDCGQFAIHGQAVTIGYFQSGRRGQGKIQIEADEVARIRELMRVHPRRAVARRPPVRQDSFPGITVPLGHPDRHP